MKPEDISPGIQALLDTLPPEVHTLVALLDHDLDNSKTAARAIIMGMFSTNNPEKKVEVLDKLRDLCLAFVGGMNELTVSTREFVAGETYNTHMRGEMK